MKKVLMSLLALFLLLNLAGCYNYEEIQRYAIITGMAVDKGKEEGHFAVTCEVLTFEMGVEGKLKPALVEYEENTVFESLRSMIGAFAKKMYAGHCKAIIVSEEIATEGVFEIYDFFLRDHEFRANISLFMAKGSSAKDMLKETAVYYEIAGYEMERMAFNDTKASSLSRQTLLYQAMNTMLSEGAELTLPIIELKEAEGGKTFHINGVALFKDGKYWGSVDKEEAKYYLSFLDELSSCAVSVETENQVMIAYELNYGKTKTKLEIKKDEFKFIVKFEVKFYVGSISHDKNDKTVELTEKELEVILAEHWKKKMLEVFEKIKELNVDSFSYGRMIMAKDFKLWKSIEDKEDIMKYADVELHVRTKCLGEGRRK